MFQELVARVRQRKVRLVTDPSLQSQIDQSYRSSSPIDFTFSIFDLVCAIGTCRAVVATKANKFSLAADFLEVFVRNDVGELRIRIGSADVEERKEMSRYIGEGLSWVVAEKLYNLKKSTMTRIKRRGRTSKPDFVGYTPSFLKVVWEAKGSTNPIGQGVIRHARNQKTNEPADIAFASMATLRARSMTEVSLKDPPPLPLEGDSLERHLSRVKHYVSTFNFIGQAELSRYFKLLGKRLESDRNFPEFYEKAELFEKLRRESIKLTINGRRYLGKMERVDDSAFLYAGFDENLLHVQDFLDFQDHERDHMFEQGGNAFRVTRDGICHGYVRFLGELQSLGGPREIDIQEIPYYKDTRSILDLDHMLPFQLIKHVIYLFERDGFEVEATRTDFDLVVRKEERRFVVEVKRNVIGPLTWLASHRRKGDTAILITTMNIPEKDIVFAKAFDIHIVDRKALKAMIRKQKEMTDLLEG